MPDREVRHSHFPTPGGVGEGRHFSPKTPPDVSFFSPTIPCAAKFANLAGFHCFLKPYKTNKNTLFIPSSIRPGKIFRRPLSQIFQIFCTFVLKHLKMNRVIEWTCSGVELPGLDYARLEQWIARVAESHKRIVGELAYIFCDDEKILEVNRRFLNHDYYTDIISFDDSCGRIIRGDMFISLDTVRSNAEEVGEPYERELLRVIIHGVLHYCGINDKGPGEREIMEENENRALEMYESDEF